MGLSSPEVSGGYWSNTAKTQFTGRVEHATGRVEHAIGRVEHAIGRVEHAIGWVEHATGRVEHATEKMAILAIFMDPVSVDLNSQVLQADSVFPN